MKSTEIQIVKDKVKLQNWAAEVRACRESGLTVVEWCEKNGIKPKNYYYHLKRLRESEIEQNGSEYQFSNQSVVGVGKLPVSDDRIEISNGRINISLPSDIMPELLLTAIGGLDNVS